MALTNRIKLDATDTVAGVILIDGERITGVQSATLRMEPERIPILELEFLVTGQVAEADAMIRYTAWAFGEYAQGRDRAQVLRDLADRLDGDAVPGVRAAAWAVIDAWRRSSALDDSAELRAAVEALVGASGWTRRDEAKV
jgi:hypothetical protein